MKVIANNGVYFCGKIKELLIELHNMSRTYKTLQELLARARQ
ncbi:hypothetical protein [Sporomusa acidovorans]|uniref:Uncharacterized protein n=1 Tax=Sporomusa acidovorans (strain ATCC 49682 / DSM 3132 / Mol) TaxID=1123286 RepID=A0ABZ3J468_SPOA4|nr:hypothetical protein [Sporomusa acidovorans]OZC20349.1 hypothetical protein SPACI_27480 [Sporomusa acidovorans DSM 3132]SDD36867.1 hypothetical protein SAMN04488499_100135 [Sporomusa acidovorans]